MIRRTHFTAAAIAFAAATLCAQHRHRRAHRAKAGAAAVAAPMDSRRWKRPAINPSSTARPSPAGMAIRSSGAWRTAPSSGRPSPTNNPKQNTFLIWRGGSPADFELKLQYKLTGFNSGIQFRSIELPDIKYAMKGYQADMDGMQQYTGQIYEERGRGFLAMRGQFSYVGEGKKPAVVGSVGDSEELKKLIKGDDWNDLHIIARGNTIIQLLNGRITSMVIDDDTVGTQTRRADRHTMPPGAADEDRSAQYPSEEAVAAWHAEHQEGGRNRRRLRGHGFARDHRFGAGQRTASPQGAGRHTRSQLPPNHVARSLKTNKTQTLGIIVPDMTISFFPQLIRGAETAARQRGYSLIAVNSDDDGERQKELLSLLRSQRVEGILLVIAAAPTPLNQLTRILDASIPMVCLDRIPDRVPVDSVSVDDVPQRRWASST